MNWDTFFLGVIAFSSLLLVLAAVLLSVGLFRVMKQLNAAMRAVEKEAVKALREVQGTAKGVTDLSSTAKRLTEETFFTFITRRMSKPRSDPAKKVGGLGMREVLLAGLGAGLRVGLRMVRSCLNRRKAKRKPQGVSESKT